MKNILFISESTDFISGAQKSMLEIISLINKKKFRCFISKTNSEEFQNKIKKLKIKQINLQLNENHGFVSYLKNILKAIRLFKKYKIDLIYITSSGTYWKPAEILAAKLINLPIITHMRWWKYNIKDSFLKYSDNIICNSNFTAKKLLNTKWAKKTKIVMNFVKFNNFVIKNKDYNKNKLQITYVGQINPIKGIKYLIKAANILKKNKNLKFLIVGQESKAYPGYKKELQKYCNKLSNIKFQDYTTNINNIYQKTDILVLPSLEEPFGRVLVEAGYLGIPCIASKVGGIPEVIEHNKTGILIKSKNPKAIANVIIDLYKNPSKRKNLAKEARKKVKKEFNPTIQIKKIENIFLNLIK